jgi:hypothetical protein
MRKKIILIGIAVTLIIGGGCKKPPSSTVENYSNVTVYPTTIAELTSIVASCYANNRNESLSGRDYMPGMASADHAANDGGPLSDFDATSQLAYHNLTPTNAYINDIWGGSSNSSTPGGFFLGVREANTTLSAVDFYQKNYAVASDSAMIHYIRGEAYFWRAYNYFMLESLFGQQFINIEEPASADANILGVPIFTAVPTTLAETQQGRATARQVWNFITSDLTQSANYLQGVSWPADQEARVTDWSAKGLLGKVYVYTQNWDSAATVLDDVILHGHGPKNNPLTLMPYSQYIQAFNDPANPGALNNNVSQKFNDESLVEIDVERVAGPNSNGIYGGAPNLNLTSSQGQYAAPSEFNPTINTANTSIGTTMGYSNQFLHDRNLLRFGFTIPIDSTIPSVQVMNPNSTTVTSYSTVFTQDAWYVKTSDSIRNNQIADPRLYVCALEPFLDTVYCKFGGVALKRPVAKSQGCPTDLYNGWSLKKFETLDANLSDINGADGTDFYLLRLADIYLLYAEARMNIGGNTDPEGLKYLNLVHQRAYNGTGTNYTHFTDATKSADPSDINLSHNALAYERFAELFDESNWWLDICRWGNSTNSTANLAFTGALGSLYNSSFGLNESNYYGDILPHNAPIIWTNTAYAFPIPTTELNANASMRAQANGGQNPGY